MTKYFLINLLLFSVDAINCFEFRGFSQELEIFQAIGNSVNREPGGVEDFSRLTPEQKILYRSQMNTKGFDGLSPVEFAAYYGHISAAKWLAAQPEVEISERALKFALGRQMGKLCEPKMVKLVLRHKWHTKFMVEGMQSLNYLRHNLAEWNKVYVKNSHARTLETIQKLEKVIVLVEQFERRESKLRWAWIGAAVDAKNRAAKYADRFEEIKE